MTNVLGIVFIIDKEAKLTKIKSHEKGGIFSLFSVETAKMKRLSVSVAQVVPQLTSLVNN